MQKVFNVSQISACDLYTINQEPLASIDLMERAAGAVFNFLIKEINTTEFYIYCGQGNNGGDGLALARMLAMQGKMVSVFIVQEKSKGTADFEFNLERLRAIKSVNIIVIKYATDLISPPSQVCIIDALFGTGLKSAPQGIIKEIIVFINNQTNCVIVIDVPSGLLCDAPLLQNESVIHATVTLSFQMMKLAYFFAENYKYTGVVKLLDIGLHPTFIDTEKTQHYFVDGPSVKKLLPNRTPIAHKGNFGHVLLLAGSKGKQGAALLAAKACLKSGAGLLTLHSIASIENALNTFLPSAMFQADINHEIISEIPDLSKFSVVAAGCGIGKAEETARALKFLIQQCKVPLLLDADALNILSENKTWLSFLPTGTILTPHPKEFERLCGKWNNSFERLQLQKEFSSKYNCVVVFKGAYTCVTTALGNSYFNSTGNAGMAKGGSGDTLTGIIAALLAQGLSSIEASIVGVYIHGLAGDFAKEKQGELSMLPEDLIDSLGTAFKTVQAL
jgi:NAD(P)H-hydrate epimerase